MVHVDATSSFYPLSWIESRGTTALHLIFPLPKWYKCRWMQRVPIPISPSQKGGFRLSESDLSLGRNEDDTRLDNFPRMLTGFYAKALSYLASRSQRYV